MRVVLAVACCFALACGGRQTPTVAQSTESANGEDVNKSIQSAFAAYKSAYESHSADTLSKLYAHDLDMGLVFQGHRFMGFTQVADFLSERLKNATLVRMTVSDLAVRSLGAQSAIAHAIVEVTIGDEAISITEKGALTLVFQKIEDKWLIVLEHFSYPPSH